jgi:hypothetical protein
VSQTAVDEFSARVESPLDKAAEIGGGGGAVETMVVIEDTYPHAVNVPENLTACLNMIEKATGKISGVNRNGRLIRLDQAIAGRADMDVGAGGAPRYRVAEGVVRDISRLQVMPQP